jgi:hypothetical protein
LDMAVGSKGACAYCGLCRHELRMFLQLLYPHLQLVAACKLLQLDSLLLLLTTCC